VKLIQGTPENYTPEIPKLIWEEDPELIGLEFGSYANWESVCEKEWPSKGAGNCHDATTLVVSNGAVCGLINAFPAAEIEPRFEKSESLRGPSHLSEKTIDAIDNLFPAPPENSHFILDISVDASVQKAGVGRQLIDHAEQAARAAHHTSLSLHVRETNPALGVYKHLGFEVIATGTVPELQAYNIQPYLLMTRPVLQ